MFLFILESIGTQELILVGIAALIFLGPRKLPELAKKAGKIMAEFRGTASEFKETWEREVDFEEEVKSLNLSELDAETEEDAEPGKPSAESKMPEAPEIRAIDPEKFKNLETAAVDTIEKTETEETSQNTDKKNWL